MHRIFRLSGCLLVASVMVARTVAADSPIPPANAREVFAEARELAARDGGKLWGRSLAGPMMFVDPATRVLAASEPGPADAALREDGGVFTGTLPAGLNAANTSIDWQGTRWTQILWPLPDDVDARRVLLLHESFHRVQPDLGLWPKAEPANAQLDTLEGRWLLRLEWLALARALQTGENGAVARRRAVEDALIFRARRQALFPGAREEENAMEETEGLAEYTGVRLGLPDDPARQIHHALGGLIRTAGLNTYVRSFAYATGPAYGLLLDGYERDRSPGWRAEFKEHPDFAQLLASRVGITLPDDLDAAVRARTTDDLESGRVRTEEEARETRRQEQLAADRRRFVEGAVLKVPLRHMNVQFDPRNLRPLDKLGTVYPTMRISDDWGVLEVTGGALLAPDWDLVTVPAPPADGVRAAKITGPGWTLELKGNWRPIDDRHGSFRLESPP